VDEVAWFAFVFIAEAYKTCLSYYACCCYTWLYYSRLPHTGVDMLDINILFHFSHFSIVILIL